MYTKTVWILDNRQILDIQEGIQAGFRLSSVCLKYMHRFVNEALVP